MPNLTPPQQQAGQRCQQINVQGKNEGKVCGQPCVKGKDTCRHHDPAQRTPSAKAARVARLEALGIRCTAKAARTQQRCERACAAGQKVCPWHGGRAPQNRAKAARVLAEQNALKELARLGVTPVTNALEELQKTAGIVVAWRDVCARIVNQLQETDIRYESGQKLEQLRSEVALWERALDRCVVALTGLARVQVDDRLAAIEQAKAVMLATALGAALMKAGIDPEVATVVRVDFAKRLRVIASEVA